jgi:hypothetical protein
MPAASSQSARTDPVDVIDGVWAAGGGPVSSLLKGCSERA